MAKGDLYNERLDLFRKTINFEKTNRIANVSCFFTWKTIDSDYGYKLSEVCNDYKKSEQVMREFHERYQFDTYIDLNIRNVVRHTKPLGKSHYVFDDENNRLNYSEEAWMNADEWDEFIADPARLNYKHVCKLYPELTKGQFRESVQEFMEYQKFCDHIVGVFADEYEVPCVYNWSLPAPMVPLEAFISSRGFAGLGIDLRRHKGKVKEAIEAQFERFTMPTMQALCDGTYAQQQNNCMVDMYTGWLVHSVLNRKQFEEFFWPHWKKMLDYVVEHNKTIYIYMESEMLRFAEYLQDYPKGHIIIHPELDDIFELRKKLPNICIAGGMKTELLGHGTAQQCVDYAKKLVDEMGEGFLFSQDKMISYPNDCTRTNLLAVNKFIQEYRV